MTTKTPEIGQSITATAMLLGWQGEGTHTSPCYDTVLKACQRGELRATQTAGRKGRWRVKPSDAITWWNRGAA